MRKTCGGYAKSGSWSPQGEGGNPSCASLGQAPGQGEKDVQDGEDRRHPEQSRIHAPQGDYLPESYRAEHLAEPFGDIVDPHRPAGSDLPGNRDFERIGSLRAGDDGIAQGEQRHAGESRREPVEKEQGNDAADAQEPAAHEPDELVGRLVHGPPEEGAEVDDHEAEQQEHPPDARRADPGLAERHGKEELEQAHGHKGAGEDIAQQQARHLDVREKGAEPAQGDAP